MRDVDKLVKLLEAVQLSELAVIKKSLSNAAGIFREAGHSNGVTEFFEQAEKIADAAFWKRVGAAAGETEELSSNGCEIEVPPGARVH